MLLLTGGTGVLGGYLVPELVARGHRVRLLVRNADAARDARFQPYLAKLDFATGALDDLESLVEACQGVDTVVHAAAVVSFRKRDRDLLKRVNEGGTANVVNAALESGVRKLVQVSSVAALGRRPGLEINEQARFRDGVQNSWYGYTKYLAERQVYRGIEEGLPAVICNPSVILGHHPLAQSSAQLLQVALRNPLIHPAGGNGFVGAADVARAIALLVESQLGNGERFILSAENLRFREVFRQFAFALGREPRFWEVPAGLARALAPLSTLIGEPGPLNATTLRTTSEVYAYDNRLFRESFQFEYTPIAQAIYDWVARWYESQGVRTRPQEPLAV